ncbi:MAG: phosphoribosylformylglycinamidine cyclo-ligase [Candidatus Marinimicrobia bacterium]|nr:phosphoribosylformylglycinamidine cyclo-ligase [Candidatus Neomarinimicrobiota bacterium]
MTDYKEAGVDIDVANEGLSRIKKHVKSTFNKYTLSDIGSFGGCFNLPISNYKDPVLISSVDGVGTKLILASLSNKHDTVGQCLVNHCVNDILVIGAKPLFFLDYFAAGKLNNDVLEDVVKGFAKACKENSCVLIGGETAEMPDFYDNNKYDLSGTIVGIADKKNMLPNRNTQPGNLLIGLKSNGLHTNGYSLARKVLLSKYKIGEHIERLNSTIEDELLKIHRSYLPILNDILYKPWLKSLSHITGGGIIENTQRVLDQGQDIIIDWSAWEWPEVFKMIQEDGNVSNEDMIRPFNLGIGMILVIEKNNLSDLDAHLKALHEDYFVIGEVIEK